MFALITKAEAVSAGLISLTFLLIALPEKVFPSEVMSTVVLGAFNLKSAGIFFKSRLSIFNFITGLILSNFPLIVALTVTVPL